MLTLARPEQPVSEEHLAFLRSVDSPTIANAIEAFRVRDRTDGFVGGGIRSLFPEFGVMLGRALTVTVTSEPGPVASPDTFWRMWDALAQMPPPSVLVMKDLSGRPNRIAYCGEVMATLAKRLGAVGIVTDGGVRDLEEVHALGLHYFAPYPVVSHGNFAVVDIAVPVILDGQEIAPGDLLHGDANGIVIVPAAIVDELPKAVRDVRQRERRLMDYIASDAFSLARARTVGAH
jgi:regulator of RNase E activity RraA